MSYTRSGPPTDTSTEGILAYLQTELELLERATRVYDLLQLETTYEAPSKIVDGLLVLADGTSWNPGSGAGFYGYYAGSWKKLG